MLEAIKESHVWREFGRAANAWVTVSEMDKKIERDKAKYRTHSFLKPGKEKNGCTIKFLTTSNHVSQKKVFYPLLVKFFMCLHTHTFLFHFLRDEYSKIMQIGNSQQWMSKQYIQLFLFSHNLRIYILSTRWKLNCSSSIKFHELWKKFFCFYYCSRLPFFRFLFAVCVFMLIENVLIAAIYCL